MNRPADGWILECTAPHHAPVKVRLLSGEYVLGREPLTCHVVLPGKQVSRRHARILVGDRAEITVEDLGSFNGTLVDGSRVQKSPLRSNDRFNVGEWSLRVRLATAQDGAVPAARTLPPSDEPAFGNEGTAMAQSADIARAIVTGETAHVRHAPSVIPAFSPAAARRPSAISALNVQWRTPVAASEEAMRERRVEDSPLLRRLTQHVTPLAQTGATADAHELAKLARNKSATQELALRLVYKVAAELQIARGEEDFLGAMADVLLQATRAQMVALLLGEPGASDANDLQAKVVRSQDPSDVSRFSRSIVEQAMARKTAVTTEDASTDERFSRNASVLDLDLKAALAVPMLREGAPVGVIYMTRRTPFSDAEEDLAAALGHLTALGIERARLKEQVAEEEALRRTLERFHTPEVVEKLMQKQAEKGTGLFMETITATVLFCDLSGFTRYCDTHSAEQVAELLNSYLGEMTRVVYEFRGTVDKYIGDAVMAVFGAPFPSADDAVRAARCAMAMQDAFATLMAARPESERLRLRVGLNTGPVVAGTVGSPLRLEYTCLGDTVNVAQRLESIATPGTVFLGKATANAIEGVLPVTPRGAMNLKGKSEPVDVFELGTTPALSG